MPAHAPPLIAVAHIHTYRDMLALKWLTSERQLVMEAASQDGYVSIETHLRLLQRLRQPLRLWRRDVALHILLLGERFTIGVDVDKRLIEELRKELHITTRQCMS